MLLPPRREGREAALRASRAERGERREEEEAISEAREGAREREGGKRGSISHGLSGLVSL